LTICTDIIAVNITHGSYTTHNPRHAYLVGGVEARIGDLLHGHGLVVRLLGADDRRVGDQGEVDTRVRDQVGLELSQVDVQRTLRSK
jgi:hypothetical protein